MSDHFIDELNESDSTELEERDNPAITGVMGNVYFGA